MRLLILLFLPVLAFGQISGVTCDPITDRTAKISWTNAAASTASSWVAFDTLTTITRRTNELGSDSSTTSRIKSVAGLAPATRYYFNPATTGETLPDGGLCPGTCTNCGSTDWSLFANGSGCDCDVAGNPPSFLTAAADVRAPTAPTHNTLTTPPSTFSTDQVTTCGGLQAAMTAIPNDGLNHRLRIAPGVCDVDAPLVPPALSSGGVLVLQPDVDDLFLPPATLPSGHTQQIDPRYAAAMVVFQYSPTSVWWLGTTSHPLFTGPAEGFFTRGIGFIVPDIADLNFRQWQVASISGADLTLTTPHDLVTFENVYLSFPSWDMVLPAGPERDNAISFRVGGVNQGLGTLQILDGPYNFPTDCGTVTCLVTAANPNGAAIFGISGNLVTTTVNHGLPNYPTSAITSITGTTLVTATDITGIFDNRSIVIKGTAGSDGVFYIASGGAASPYTLNAAPGDCSGGCGGGTVQRAPIINLHGTNNANFPYHFTVPAANQLLLEDASGLSEVGGYAIYEPSQVGPLINTDGSSGIQRATFSQGIWGGPGFPYRFKAALGGAPTQVRIQGSWATGISAWRQINPLSKIYTGEDNDPSFFAPRFAFWETGNGTGDGAITQTMLYDQTGIAWFIGDQPTTSANYSFDRNTVWRDDRLIWGTLNNNTRYYLAVQAIECKGCERVSIQGNFFRGWGSSEFVPNAYSINLSLRAGSGGKWMRDILLRSNVFDEWSSTGIGIDAADNSGLDINPCERIAIEQNWYASRGTALLVDSPVVGSGGGDLGTFALLFCPGRDITTTNNTVYHARAKAPVHFRYAKGRVSGHPVTDNIFAFGTANSDVLAGMFANTDTLFGITPPPARAQGNDAYNAYVRQEPNIDTTYSGFTGNVLHGGVRDPHLGDFDAKMAAVGEVTDAVVAAHYAGGFLTGNTNVSGATGNDREEAVYQDNSFDPDPAYAGKGADLTTIQDEMLRPGPISVSVTPTSITLSYRSPTTSGCIVDLSSDQFASQVTRQQDTGTGQSRSVTFSGLTAQRYDYRIHCGAVGPSGYATPGG